MAVPFARQLKKGQHKVGGDVRAIQRTLKELDIRKAPITGHYGKGTANQIKHFQAHHGLVADGVYGYNTHGKFVKEMKHDSRLIYKAYIVQRVAMLGVGYAPSIHYLQQRPMQDMAPWPNIPEYCDCSEFATWTFKCAGFKDPNGLDYNGYGNTYTMVSEGRKVGSIRDAVPGRSLVFYGRTSWGAPTHVAIYVSHHQKLVFKRYAVVSHGSEGGPFFLDYRYRHDIHSIRVYE